MKYLLNVDCLEFRGSTTINLNQNLSNSIYKFSNGLFIKLLYRKENILPTYSYFFKIYYYENEIGDLYTKSLDLSLVHGFNIKVKINNHIFYSQDLGLALKMIYEALELNDTKISRLDICYDTDEDVLTKFKTLFNELSIRFRDKDKIYHNGTGKYDPTSYVGSMKGRLKCINIYNKTKEINYSHKEYIRNLHRKVFGYINIYRIELKLLEKLFDMANIDLMSLSNNEYIETIFNTYFETLIYFIDIRTNEKIDFINLNNTGIKIKRILKKRNIGSCKKIKEILNVLDKEYRLSEKSEERNAFKLVINKFIKDNELETWWSMKKKVK